MSQPIRCEGWRRYGGAFSFGPVTWRQCENEAVVLLTVMQDGKRQDAVPACETCLQECLDRHMTVLGIETIERVQAELQESEA